MAGDFVAGGVVEADVVDDGSAQVQADGGAGVADVGEFQNGIRDRNL